ncbi:MAG: diaminopimelate decarboxylase, partial [Methyloversatilis sp.]|nr:diaminopimelate decarboxylase [Methyloversatilis sp.]
AAAKVVALAEALNRDGIELRHLDLGGGLGIRYDDEDVPATRDYLAPLLAVLAGRQERLLLEPGRSLVGNAGVLLSKIEYLKRGEERNFAIIDAAMNDLARPALYDAYHRIAEVRPRGQADTYDVVGPVCESGDFLGRARELAVEPEDLVAIFSAGAYGMTMSSNYNTRPRAAEVMVDGDKVHLIRARERIADLYAGERLLP